MGHNSQVMGLWLRLQSFLLYRRATLKLTAIRAQRRASGRVNIYIDDEYAFSLQAILAARLTVGQEFSEDRIAELKAADAVEKAYERALNYLSYRPRSEDEIKRYLAKRALSDEEIDQVVERLKRARLLDDKAFAEFWVENREAFRPRGSWALRGELRQKGVSPETIEAALDGLDERDSAMRAASSGVRRYRQQERDDFYRHLMGFLQRRGFSYGIARAVTEHYWSELQSERDATDRS